MQVSPHEFMQAVMAASNKRFTIEQQGDAVEFWSWFINQLHLDLTGGKRKKASVISKCFQVWLQPAKPDWCHLEGGSLRICVLYRSACSLLFLCTSCTPNNLRGQGAAHAKVTSAIAWHARLSCKAAVAALAGILVGIRCSARAMASSAATASCWS